MDDSKAPETNRGLTEWWRRGDSVQSGAELPTTTDLIRPSSELPTTPARGIVAFFSENRKEGRWAVPRYLRVLSVFASVKVDLREAILQHRESVIEAKAVFAEIQIIVPSDVIVECDGDAFMGAFTLNESKRRGRNIVARSPGAPVVRVIGSAYLASVTVKVRPPK